MHRDGPVYSELPFNLINVPAINMIKKEIMHVVVDKISPRRKSAYDLIVSKNNITARCVLN